MKKKKETTFFSMRDFTDLDNGIPSSNNENFNA